jgi:hypothetical protein
MSKKESIVDPGIKLSLDQEEYSSKKNGRASTDPKSLTDPSRRSFLNKAGGMMAVALAAAVVPIEPLLGGKESRAEASVISYQSGNRADASLNYRDDTANAEHLDIGILPDNGDAARFTDHSAIWHKALLHDDLEIVNQNAWNSFTTALTSGNFEDFQNVIVGNPGGTNFTGTLNGPMGSYAFDLEGLDSHATSVPPSPSVTSAQEAAEAVEHYWAALLRDVSFIDYPVNATVALAAADMNKLSFVLSGSKQGPPFPVTPFNLFRGQSFKGDGNVKGPFVSQFLIQPTFYGAQPLSQRARTFLPGQDFMTTVDEFKRIQNGQVPSTPVAFDPTFRFLRNGRSLAAYTRADALHDEYFTAALLLLGINAPLNPGNPYIGSQTQHGFGTLGGPDILGTIPEMATRALKGVWFHKWVVNLRHRPENYGALVHARLTNRSPFPQAAGALHPDVFVSAALPLIKAKFGTFLLPQAFPEGAPSHPCYPTGHGTVGGACITAIKFFFDGNQKIRPLLLAAGSDVMQPNSDGTALVPYTGLDRDDLTINGELSKLAWNVTTGHGIHAGIHFRSSSFWSIELGEQIGLSVLQDRAKSYGEPFDISITKVDGTTTAISNPGHGQL